jgi:hypothetical protein
MAEFDSGGSEDDGHIGVITDWAVEAGVGHHLVALVESAGYIAEGVLLIVAAHLLSVWDIWESISLLSVAPGKALRSGPVFEDLKINSRHGETVTDLLLVPVVGRGGRHDGKDRLHLLKD